MRKAFHFGLVELKGDAPEIDGLVYVPPTLNQWSPGDIIKVNIHDSDEYDLFGSAP